MAKLSYRFTENDDGTARYSISIPVSGDDHIEMIVSEQTFSDWMWMDRSDDRIADAIAGLFRSFRGCGKKWQGRPSVMDTFMASDGINRVVHHRGAE